jgi:hypothetical protein
MECLIEHLIARSFLGTCIFPDTFPSDVFGPFSFLGLRNRFSHEHERTSELTDKFFCVEWQQTLLCDGTKL